MMKRMLITLWMSMCLALSAMAGAVELPDSLDFTLEGCHVGAKISDLKLTHNADWLPEVKMQPADQMTDPAYGEPLFSLRSPSGVPDGIINPDTGYILTIGINVGQEWNVNSENNNPNELAQKLMHFKDQNSITLTNGCAGLIVASLINENSGIGFGYIIVIMLNPAPAAPAPELPAALTGEKTSSVPTTGDNAPSAMWTVLMAASGTAVVGLWRKRSSAMTK